MKYLKKHYRFISEEKSIGVKLDHPKDHISITESLDNKDMTTQIIETMLDFIEEGYLVKFMSDLSSHSGGGGTFVYRNANFLSLTYQELLDNPELFVPQTTTSSGILVSHFSIRFLPNQKFKNYRDFVKICDEMQVTIDKLADLDWSFAKFEVGTFGEQRREGSPESEIGLINFKFTKKQVKGENKFSLEEFKKSFSKQTGLYVTAAKDYDRLVTVEFDSIAYDGELPRDIEKRFEKVIELYGFATYDYRWPQKEVDFYWNED